MSASIRITLSLVGTLALAELASAAALENEVNATPQALESPLNLSLAKVGQRGPALAVDPVGCGACGSRSERLRVSIAASAKASLVEQGIGTAIEAIQDCLKGDYPGGGMGSLSFPLGQPSARTDHCYR
jgi:hypothetical protein